MTPKTALRIFVSCTAKDLGAHASAASKAIRKLGHTSVHHTDWPASGTRSVEACLKHVATCELLVVIVAHRYGWVPTVAEDGDGERSITWLEVEHAAKLGLGTLPFLVEEDAPWPPKQIEGITNPAAQQSLDRFKGHLNRGIASSFSSPASLAAEVSAAVATAAESHTRSDTPAPSSAPTDEREDYRSRLEASLRRVSLIGFGEQFQIDLPIDELYVPLRARVPRAMEVKGDRNAREFREQAEHTGDILVEDAFREAGRSDRRGVVLLGDPGSGKTTAAQRITWTCATRIPCPGALDLPDDITPVLLRLRDLREDEVDQGLVAFAERTLESIELCPGTGFGQRLLGGPPLLWVLDGLDEVAQPDLRERVSADLRDLLRKRPKDRFLVTSRYAGYEGDAVLGDLFVRMDVDALDSDQRHDFVLRWYRTVETAMRGSNPDAWAQADTRAADLNEILSSSDFRALRLVQLVQNPLLLSILCVVHRKDVELPRRRADLYEKCLDVLLESWRLEWRRRQNINAIDGRVARLLLQPIAWYLQEEERRDAPLDVLLPIVEATLDELGDAVDELRDPAHFLDTVRNDSGLLVTTQPGRFAFLHLTLQEHLAALHALTSETPAALAKNACQPWWHETILLALAMADRADYVEDFFAQLLREEELDSKLLSYALLETLRFPTRALTDILEASSTPIDRLTLVLRELPDQRVKTLLPALDRVARRHDADEIVVLAQRHLSSAGAEVPVGVMTPDEQRLVHEASGVRFVLVPAGSFSMGGKAYDDEQPVHSVTITKPFWLAEHPVTNRQYERFLRATDRDPPEYWGRSGYDHPDQPVVGVSWDDAFAFGDWAELRLPSEAEWEYACRAGTTSAYSSGDTEADLSRAGWWSGNSEGRLHSVGEKEANAFGLYDMHGNVWEWCQDEWSENYDESAGVHPAAFEPKESGSRERVVRGGGYRYDASNARSASRDRDPPDVRFDLLGFRPALTP